MKRLSFYLIAAVMCFATGIITDFVWHFDGNLPKNEAPAPPVKVCKVHGVRMLLEPVPVKYELHNVLNITEVEAQQQWFPNSNRFGEGECEPPNVAVYYCPLCRAAQASWEKMKGYHTSRKEIRCGSD